MRAGGGSAEARPYPALGGNANTGHGLLVLPPNVWRDDVPAFLDARLQSAGVRTTRRTGGGRGG